MLGEDWPHELFVEKADLYLLQLNERLAQAEAEAEHLTKLFAVHGIPPSSRIIDLCCGIGRHSVTLAKRGYSVVGVDFSPKLLQRAQELAKKAHVEGQVEFLHFDVREIGMLPQRGFDVALCLFTSFVGYYGEEEDQKFFSSVRSLVRPGGIFILDIAPRDRIIRSFQPLCVAKAKTHLILEEATFSWETSRNFSRWLFFLPEGEGWRYAGEARVDIRLYSLHELIRLIRETGWDYGAAYGGLDMSPYGFEARRLVVVAKNPGGRGKL